MILIDYRKDEGMGYMYVSSMEELGDCVKWVLRHKERMARKNTRVDSIIDVFDIGKVANNVGR